MYKRNVAPIVLAAVAAAGMALAIPSSASAANAGIVGVAEHHAREHSRQYDEYHYNSPSAGPYAGEGFDDPGFAYHGNVNGCAEDLGYGRYESCDN
jgi:hypothetical protein